MSLCGVDGFRTHYLMLAKHMLQPDELQPHISGDRSIRHSYTFMYLWFSNPRPFPKASHLHCCILGLQRNPLFTTKIIYQVGQGSSVKQTGFEPVIPTSQMQSLNHLDHYSNFLIVGTIGVEPILSESKSDVPPLHQIPI